MLFTQTYLSNQIKNIKCAYATYMSKYSKALAYGLATEKCLYNNMVVLKWYIKLLERFNSQGVECTSTPPCQVANNTFTTETACFTNDEEFQECYVPARVPIDFPVDAVETWVFTDTTVTLNGGYTVDYTYIGDTLTLSDGNVFTVVFNDDCSAASFSTTIDEVPIVFNTIITATDNAEYTCDWSSECVTPLEIQEIIKHSYTLLGRNCNC